MVSLIFIVSVSCVGPFELNLAIKYPYQLLMELVLIPCMPYCLILYTIILF